MELIGRPGTPSYSVIDVYAPPLVLFGASISLLAAFGLLHWIIGMAIAIGIWSFVQPRELEARMIPQGREKLLSSDSSGTDDGGAELCHAARSPKKRLHATLGCA